VLVPSGGRDVVESFQQLVDKVLSQTVWGVDFFMLCDRDTTDASEATALEHRADGRLRYLKRYHLENYFLDAAVLASVFDDIEGDGSWLRDQTAIEHKLRQLAISTIPYATALIVSAQLRRDVGNVSIMPRGLDQQGIDDLVVMFLARVADETQRAGLALQPTKVEALIRGTYGRLQKACNGTDWKVIIPGKPVLSRFAALTVLDVGRLKLAYIKAAQKCSSGCFDEIVDIFADFAGKPTRQKNA